MPLPYEYKFTLYDKIGHFILFGLFSFLVFYTLKDIKKIKKTWLYLISFLLGFFYSALAEWLQADLPTRTVSELDFLAGLIGVTVFLFLAYLLYGGKK